MRVGAGVVDKPLVNLLEEALSALGEGDSALRARVLARLARELYFSAASADRRALLSRQAVEMARRVGDTAALATALQSRHLILWGPGDVKDRLAAATEIVQLAEEAGEREKALQGHELRLINLLELGDIPAVDEEIETYARLAEELRQPRYLWYVEMFRAMRALMEGWFEEGEQLAMQALATGQQVQSQTAANYFGAQMFSLRREQGRLQELEAAVKGFVEQYPAVSAWRRGLASLYSELGREVEARSEFERLATNDFADLPQDSSWLVSVHLLSEVCAFLGDSRRAATLYELLLPYAGHNAVVGQAAVCIGSVSRNLGLLAATMARWEEAAQHFEDALKMNAKMGARPLIARTQYEYATMLLARDQPGDRERALELLNKALDTAQELGMKGLEEKIKFQVSGFTFPVPSPESRIQEPEPRILTTPTPNCGLQPSDSGPQASSLQPPNSDVEANIFRREGEYWDLAYQGTVCRLKDAKGLHYIAFLLCHPGREFHAVELVRAMGKHQETPTATTYGRLSEDQLAEHNLSVGELGDAGEVFDAQAKAAYKRRLEELGEELEEAQRFNDPVRAAKAQAEIDFLTDELAAAVGLNGRNRKAASVAERARLNVTKSIKAALSKIGKNHLALGQHLTISIRTGTFCSYAPDPTRPISWTL
jgi:tetratricopeptide (TPR) repeat protein